MNGLTTKAARERLKQDGENELAAAAKLHPLRMFLGQFRDVMVLILLAATGVSAFLGEISDAVTIILIVLLNAILGFLQEYRTEQTLESLRSLTAPTATVCRDGKWQTIPARELVCGDCIRLEAGDNVPADSALVRADGLSVNESILTGESEAVSKQSGDPADTRNDLHKKNVVYAGTAVLHGSAEAVVIATGTRTQMGQISAMLQEVKQDLTPLQKRLAGLGKVVALLCLGVCGAVFLAGVLRGEPVFDMLMTGITIAIAAIPEGLPATVTIALALAVSRMMKRNALVNRLHSVETLGCASVICSDKTGTITENRMTVTAVRVGGESFSVTGTGLQKAGAIQQDGRNVNPLSKPALKELLICGALCCTAEIHSPQESARRDRSARTDKGSWSATGDPTEVALLVAAEKGGVSRQELLRSHPVLRSEPFDSETRRMSVTVTQGAGTCTYWKGAADAILPLCGFQMRDGKTVPFSESDRAAVRRSVTELSDQALRVLAFARQEDGACVFLGLAGMLDPPRESARTAIRTCARANIRTVMITGDHKNTAAAIAKQAGLLRGKKAMTGDELDALSDAQLDACLDQYTVFARVNPAHKLRLVRAYRRRGEIVAMTGDGGERCACHQGGGRWRCHGKKRYGCGSPGGRRGADGRQPGDAGGCGGTGTLRLRQHPEVCPIPAVLQHRRGADHVSGHSDGDAGGAAAYPAAAGEPGDGRSPCHCPGTGTARTGGDAETAEKAGRKLFLRRADGTHLLPWHPHRHLYPGCVFYRDPHRRHAGGCPDGGALHADPVPAGTRL